MSLFGYYSLGLQSLNVARLGLEVAGDNIANVFTPGYARRGLDLAPGYPVAVPGGFLDGGVDVLAVRRMEDQFLQASLYREQGRQAGSEELLRGLGHVESIFGRLDESGSLANALAEFSAGFSALAGEPDSSALRGGALAAADALASSLRGTYDRLGEQRRIEDQSVQASVDRINTLAEELAVINRDITVEEATGAVSGPLRDRRTTVLEELFQLTGGSAASDPAGRVDFSLPSGPTLVSGVEALPLRTSRATDGTLRVLSGADGTDVTDRLRDGQLGSKLYLRDEVIAGNMDDLDALAAELITQANALTTGAIDLEGNAGQPLFVPDPPTASGIAGLIAVNGALLDDPDLLAVSSTGAPGEGDVALLLAGLPDRASAALGDRSPSAFVADMLSGLGTERAGADVAEAVSRSLVEGMLSRRDAVSGVSLDEEAVQLVRFQQSYEAAARFIEVLNSVTETAVNLVRR